MVPVIKSSEARDDGFKSRSFPTLLQFQVTRDFPSQLPSSLVLLLEPYHIFKLCNFYCTSLVLFY